MNYLKTQSETHKISLPNKAGFAFAAADCDTVLLWAEGGF